MAQEKTEHSNGAAGTFILVVMAAVAVFVLLVPAVVAAVVYWPLRSRVTRRDGILLAAAAFLALVAANALSHGGALSVYFHWLDVLVLGHGNRWDIPAGAILLVAALLVGIAGTVRGSRVAAWGIKTFSKKTPIGEIDSIIPSDREQAQLSVAPAPTEAMVIHQDQHSVTSGEPVGKRTFPIGRGRNGQPVLLNEAEVGTHTLMFGSTGSGKTVSLEAMAGALLDLGWDGVILDLKEDTKAGGFYEWTKDYAHGHSLPFQELRLSEATPPYWFNPLEAMGPDEARDTILSLVELQDAYWAALNRKTLGQVCTLFWMAHEIDPVRFPTPTMAEIGKLLESPNLEAAAKERAALIISHYGTVYSKDSFNALLRPTKAEAESAASFGARITGVYGTQAGRAVLSPADNRHSLDITQSGLTYIGLDSLGKADLTRLVSSAVLQRLSVYASQRTTGHFGASRQRFVLIDEAGWVDRMIVQNLLSRARSAGIALILATQGPKDWEGAPGTPGFEMLAQNCNVGIIMSQGEPANAEICAEYLGQRTRDRFSQSVRDGALVEGGSISQFRDYIVGPDELRALTVGECIVRVGKPRNRIEWAKVMPRDPAMVARR